VDLFETVRRSPRDVHVYQVLSDALLAQGDPWGELIGLQCSLEKETHPGRFLERKNAAEALKAQLHPRLLGAVGLWGDALRLAWRWGFVGAATLAYVPVELGEGLTALFEAPACTALQSLTAWQLERSGRGGDYVRFTQLLCEKAPKSLRTLQLGGIGDVAALLAAHPDLETLELMSAEGEYQVPEPRLHRLRLAQCCDAAFGWLSRASWPELRALEHSGSGRDHALASELTPKRFPKLTELRAHGDSCDAFLTALDSEMFPQLSVLELHGEYSDASLEALIAARTRLQKVKKLTLYGLPLVSRKLWTIARKQLPNLSLLRERDGSD
jgi:hypothetical protein